MIHTHGEKAWRLRTPGLGTGRLIFIKMYSLNIQRRHSRPLYLKGLTPSGKHQEYIALNTLARVTSALPGRLVVFFASGRNSELKKRRVHSRNLGRSGISIHHSLTNENQRCYFLSKKICLPFPIGSEVWEGTACCARVIRPTAVAQQNCIEPFPRDLGRDKMSSKQGVRKTITAIMVLGLILSGCGKTSNEKKAEKIAEKILSESTGNNVDVTLQKDKIKIEGSDLQTTMESTTVWPSEMFREVPEFTFGKIERVVKSNEDGGMRKFNVYFTSMEANAVSRYASLLQKNGWEAQVTQMGEGGLLNAQKGKLAMNFPFSTEKRSGALLVFASE
jgi:hypothetical protein